MSRSHHDVYEDFINGRLGHDEWTHEAHLVTCWMSLQTRTPAESLAHLRESIQTHNCGIGIANTDESGYHETLTVYFVTAIAAIDAPEPEALFADPRCTSAAPLRHWSRDELFSVAARRNWVAPDLSPLPWPAVDAASTTR